MLLAGLLGQWLIFFAGVFSRVLCHLFPAQLATSPGFEANLIEEENLVRNLDMTQAGLLIWGRVRSTLTSV